jgi:zinc protease
MTDRPPAGALASAFLDGVHREVLPNGLTLLVRRDPSAPVVAIYTRVGSGYFDEPDDVVGISHVLEHMYFKGTPTRGPGDIARDTRARGGQLNAYTTYDHTAYYAIVPSAAWQEALDIQFDAYAHSVIDAGELARELEVIVEEARRKLDAPGAVASESLYAMLFDHHRMRRWRIGQPEQLRTFTREQVHGFYRAHYRPSNTIVAIVGDVEPAAVRDAVAARYGALTAPPVARDRGPVESEPAPSRVRDWTGDLRQAQLVFGWRVPPRDHPDAIAVGLVGRVLGDGRSARLYRALREREWATAVGAHDYHTGDVGVFTIHADAPPPHVAAAASACWRELDELRARGVGPAEVSRLRDVTVSRWHRTLESMESQAALLVEWEGTGGLARGAARLEARLATPAEAITEAARAHLDPARASLVHYRPRDAAPLDRDAPIAVDAGEALARVGAGATVLDSVGAATEAPPWGAVAIHVGQHVQHVEQVHGVHVYRTREGDVPVLVRRHHGTPLVHIGVHVRGGVAVEAAGREGLARATVLAALRGVPGRTAAQIADAAERLGGPIGTTAGAETAGWTLSAPIARAEEAMRLLGAVVLEPLLPVDTLRTEMRLARAELDRARDDMAREPQRLLLEAAWATHPYARSPLGVASALAGMAVEEHDVLADAAQALHARATRAGEPVIAIVGDADPDALAALAGQTFARLARGEAPHVESPTWPAGARDACVERDKQQTALALAFPAPARTSASRYAGVLLASIASGLGGRFFEELRSRRSLAYTVSAGPHDRRAAGCFLAYIATQPAREEEARAGLLAEFARFVDEPVTLEELERARRAVLGARAIALQGGAARLGQLLDVWTLGRGLVELEDVDARLLAETPESLHAYARTWFDPTRVVTGVVRGRTP